jgi:hypothetical protein
MALRNLISVMSDFYDGHDDCDVQNILDICMDSDKFLALILWYPRKADIRDVHDGLDKCDVHNGKG